MSQGSQPSENTPPPKDSGSVEFKPKRSFGARLRTYFLTGIVVAAPISITIYLTWLFIVTVDSRVTPLIPSKYNPETYLPFGIPGFGVITIIVFLILLGMITANFFGRSLIGFGERLVNKMPVVRSVYGTLKQIFETIISQSSMSFRDVVLVEYPRRGMYAIAFVTAPTKGEIAQRIDTDMFSVFLPTTPNPTSGFLLFVRKDDVIDLDMTVEEGVKYVISAGLVTPPVHLAKSPLNPPRERELGDEPPTSALPIERDVNI